MATDTLPWILQKERNVTVIFQSFVSFICKQMLKIKSKIPDFSNLTPLLML